MHQGILRWYGGKSKLAGWIVENLPAHRVYVEPFGGGASVLLKKTAATTEVLADMDDDLVNLYRVLADETDSRELQQQVRLTPYARLEFEEACEPRDGLAPVERARRLLIRQTMGWSPDARLGAARTGWRCYTGDARQPPTRDWLSIGARIPELHARLAGVRIEHATALETIARHDGPGTLFYLDPPYLPETRKAPGRGYRHEMSVEDHELLLDAVLQVRGMVVISGYASPLYDERLVGWARRTRRAADLSRAAREEVLWLSPRAIRALPQPGLFDAA